MDTPAINGPITRREAILTATVVTIASILTAAAFAPEQPAAAKPQSSAEQPAAKEPFQLAF